MNFYGHSQSLIPIVIKINSTKYYCFDSVGIRKIAVELNNAMYGDSIIESQAETIKDLDSLGVVKDSTIQNLERQVKLLKAEKVASEAIITDLGGNKTWVGGILAKFGDKIKTGLAVAGGVAILVLVAEHL